MSSHQETAEKLVDAVTDLVLINIKDDKNFGPINITADIGDLHVAIVIVPTTSEALAESVGDLMAAQAEVVLKEHYRE